MHIFCCGNLLNVLRHIDNGEIMLYTCIINQGNEEMNNKSSNPAKLKRSEDQGNGAADVANALIFILRSDRYGKRENRDHAGQHRHGVQGSGRKRCHGAHQRDAGHQEGRVHLAARSLGLRQDDAPQNNRGPAPPDFRNDHGRRSNSPGGEAGSAVRNRIPESGALRLADSPQERDAPAGDNARPEGRARGHRRRNARDGRAYELREPLSEPAFRRHAAEGRNCEGAGDTPGDTADGRAVLSA